MVVDVDVVDEVDVVSAVESPVAAGSVDDSLGSVVSARIGASDDATTAASTDTSTASVAALTVESGGSGTRRLDEPPSPMSPEAWLSDDDVVASVTAGRPARP